MNAVETRAPGDLRAHPENATIFGDPEESDAFAGLLLSIKHHGIWEPLAIKPDGTVLSGHMRRAVAIKLGLREVPVRVVDAFASYRDELEYLIRSNTDRRQLTKAEIAIAFRRLRETPRDQGGTKGKKGGGEKGKRGAPAQNQSSASGPMVRSDDEAAAMLGIGKHEARALETVFTTPGVPEPVKRAVNAGALAPTTAAKAIVVEAKRQGVDLKSGAALADSPALRAVAEPKRPAQKSEHERRVEDEAEKYRADYRALFDLYGKLDGILTRRPLKSVLGPTEHHEYTALIRDVALRAWREVESIQGPTNAGKQMALSVIAGGKS